MTQTLKPAVNASAPSARLGFREHHFRLLLERFSSQTLPIDVFLSLYFRQHKALGSKDKKFLSDHLYTYIRWKALATHLGADPLHWNPLDHVHDLSLPPPIRLSLPEPLYTLLVQSYGVEEAQRLALASNERAPTTIRVNTLKISRDALIKKLNIHSQVIPCELSPYGITFLEKINLFALEEFREGLFEVQDEGSQLVALLVKAKPKDQVLDFCAGSGGKALAIGALMQGKGQLYLHDIRPKALLEAKRRLKRAGIQNAQFGLPRHKVDWALVDAPCSGSGTYRRNPDLKWKFSLELLERVVLEQRKIFEEALTYLKPGGKIVYATCSILPQENEAQSAYFQEKFSLKETMRFQSFPYKSDGFFGAVFVCS